MSQPRIAKTIIAQALAAVETAVETDVVLHPHLRDARGGLMQFTAEQLWNGDFKPWGWGVRYFIAGDEADWDDEMSYDVLAHCVRTDPRFGFEDGQTIEEAGSHSEAELWSDVIAPALLDGRIEAYVWGERIEFAG